MAQNITYMYITIYTGLYALAATAFSTTDIITDMREGRRLTIFRRSIHLCPVIADCDTMFKKHTPNCTDNKNVHLLCIHVPFWPSTTPHLQNKQTRTKVYNVHPTHTISNKDKMAIACLPRSSGKVFVYPWPSQSSDWQQEDHDIAYTLRVCFTLLLPDF